MFRYRMFYLKYAEYAKIVSEINTNYVKYEGKKLAVYRSMGIDNRYYWYYFENAGFDSYNIYARV